MGRMFSLSHRAGEMARRFPGGQSLLSRLAGASNPHLSPVFMLHRVLPPASPVYDPEMAVSVVGFEQLLAWIAERYDVVRLGDLAQIAPRPGRPRCALTFDDGWSDTYTHAFPLLQRWRMSATVFLPVHFIGTGRRFWQESLFYHLRNLRARADGGQMLQAVATEFAWCPRLQAADLGHRRLSQRLRRRASSEAEDFVARLGEVAGSSLELTGRAFMNWDEVRAMQRSGIEFGSHTLEHTHLATVSPSVSARELSLSRQALSEQLDCEVTSVAYPWGARGPFAVKQAAAAGYAVGVTTQPGFVGSGEDQLQWPRLAISEAQLGWPGHQSARRAGRLPATLAVHLARARRHRAPAPDLLDPDGRLRIAILVDPAQDWGETAPAQRGGSELQLYHMLLALDPAWFAVELCFLNTPLHGLPSQLPWPSFHGASASAGRWRTLDGMRRLLQRRQPALAFAMFRTSLFLGVPAAWLARVPAIVCSRRNAGYWRRWFHLVALRVVNRMATGWQTNGPAIGDVLARTEGVPALRVDILPNWLDLERFHLASAEDKEVARRALKIPAHAFVVLSTANYNRVKDLPTLVAAAALVARELPAARFLLLGQGDQRQRLEHEIQAQGLEGNVWLLGAQDDVTLFLAAADIGVLTSTSEGCSNAVLEYMAAGLPTVLSDIPANRALSTVGLVPVGNPERLAAELLHLRQNPDDVRNRAQENLRRMAPYSQGNYDERVQAHFVTLAGSGRLEWRSRHQPMGSPPGAPEAARSDAASSAPVRG